MANGIDDIGNNKQSGEMHLLKHIIAFISWKSVRFVYILYT